MRPISCATILSRPSVFKSPLLDRRHEAPPCRYACPGGVGSGRNTISKTSIAILFIIVISALCVAVHAAWLDTFQAVAVLVVMVGLVVGLMVKAKEGD